MNPILKNSLFRVFSISIATLFSVSFALAATEAKKVPIVKPLQKGNSQYSVSMREIPCPPATPEEAKIPTTLNSVIKMCGYSFSAVATAVDNGEQIWQSELYNRNYNLEKDKEAQLIHPVSLKLVKGTSVVVKNQRGDEFTVWTERGYLTKPKSPKSYPTEK